MVALTNKTALITGASRGIGLAIARRNPDMAEPVELMAEAALVLCTGSHVGRVGYSRQLLHALGLPVKSLDGLTVLGDAFLAADLEGSA